MITYGTVIDYNQVKYKQLEAHYLEDFKKTHTIVSITPLKRIIDDHHGYREKVELGILYIDLLSTKEKEHVHNR